MAGVVSAAAQAVCKSAATSRVLSSTAIFRLYRQALDEFTNAKLLLPDHFDANDITGGIKIDRHENRSRLIDGEHRLFERETTLSCSLFNASGVMRILKAMGKNEWHENNFPVLLAK